MRRPHWRRHPLHGHALRLLEAGLEGAWCRETASPGCREAWNGLNPAFGQCAVTALFLEKALREDFGTPCEILRGEAILPPDHLPSSSSHYWIRLRDGTEVDMTRDQFPEGTTITQGEPRSPASLLEGERAEAARTAERLELLARLCEDGFGKFLADWIVGKLLPALTEDAKTPA